MLPTSGMAKVHGYADKTVADTKHANAPFRDHHLDGHDLNESYKLPAPIASGTNLSYMHPLVGGRSHGNAPGFPTPKVLKIAPVQTGKGKG